MITTPQRSGLDNDPLSMNLGRIICDVASLALLALADGLLALQANCLAIDGRLVMLTDDGDP